MTQVRLVAQLPKLMTYLPGGVRFDHSGVGGSIGLKGVNYSAFANAHKRTLEVTNR